MKTDKTTDMDIDMDAGHCHECRTSTWMPDIDMDIGIFSEFIDGATWTS
jgi:hypothetical protein